MADEEFHVVHHASPGYVPAPSQIDCMIRQMIQACWTMLPEEKRNPDEAERQVRRIVDRALKDFREDCNEFWRGQPG